MKTLFISFLIAVLALQGAVTVLGLTAPQGMEEPFLQAYAGSEPACEQELPAGLTDISPAVEELSDYLPAALSTADGYCRRLVVERPNLHLFSIILPSYKPPPRI